MVNSGPTDHPGEDPMGRSTGAETPPERVQPDADDATGATTATPDPRARRRLLALPGEPTSIGRARQAALRACAEWELGGGPAAELVVSELVANAVLHGWGQVRLTLLDLGDALGVEVEDDNPAPPVTTEGHPGRLGGFGMQVVERLAEWGWRPSGTGKVVWARLRPVASGSGLSLRAPR